MGRRTKIIFWVSALFVGAAFTALQNSSHAFHFSPGQTLKQYMRDVADKETLGDIATKVAGHVTARHGPGFDTGGFERSFETCLHQRVDAWLNGDDPLLGDPVTKEDVDALAGKFTTACLTEVAKTIP